MRLTFTGDIREVGGMSKLPTMTPEELRAARAEMQLTQAEAAKFYNVSLSGYKKWELGERKIDGPAVPLTKYLLDKFRNIRARG